MVKIMEKMKIKSDSNYQQKQKYNTNTASHTFE